MSFTFKQAARTALLLDNKQLCSCFYPHSNTSNMSATPPPSKRRKLESVLPSSTKKQKPTNKKSTSSAGEKRCKHANTKKKPEFVWGKVKSYPWWPAVIIRPSDYKTVSKSVIKKKPENATLVQFFGSYD